MKNATQNTATKAAKTTTLKLTGKVAPRTHAKAKAALAPEVLNRLATDNNAALEARDELSKATAAPTIQGTAPDVKFPFGLTASTPSGLVYERFKTAKQRDRRLNVLSGKKHAVAPVDYEAPQGIAVVAPAAAAKTEKAPKAEKPENPRITPGTPIKEWRSVKSARASFKGYFVQGGQYREGSKGKQFFVAVEERYTTVEAAKEALASKEAK